MGDQEETSVTSPATHDTLTIASNLPVELLQMIFIYYTELKDLPVGPYPACPAWIAVTHVCRHWRAAALNYSLLWTLINTDVLGKGWIKPFMERSKSSLIDVTLRINHVTDGIVDDRNVDELFSVFAGCTRLRSLHIIGELGLVFKLLDTLHIATHIRSLSLDITGQRPVKLPDNLFGKQAPIRAACFANPHSYYIATPHWLLRGITHFTSSQQIPFRDMLDTLRHMPVLYSLTLERCSLVWHNDDVPRDRILMQSLMYLTVDVGEESAMVFLLLHELLALPDGARKRIRWHIGPDSRYSCGSRITLLIHPSLKLNVFGVVAKLQHVQFSGGYWEGGCYLWSGDTGYEEAEFFFEFSWKIREEIDENFVSPIFDLATVRYLLGVKRAPKLGVPMVVPDYHNLRYLKDMLKELLMWKGWPGGWSWDCVPTQCENCALHGVPDVHGLKYRGSA